MSDICVKKLSFEEIFNSATMFYVNEDYEKTIENEVQEKVDELYLKLKDIATREGLEKYIRENKDALDNITSLMEISTERFKRMVSMIRKDRGFVFQTEWGLGKIRTAMLDSQAMMENVINLIMNGRNDEKLRNKIPFFYLDNMVINDTTMKKLTDKDAIRLFVKRGLEGKYSNNISDTINRDIEKKIKSVCAKYGLDYQKEVRVPALDRTVSFVLENPNNPTMIIDVSYSVTTSSAQGEKKNTARIISSIVKERTTDGHPCTYVNFLDGAGWIARQADMKDIFQSSDYTINFNNIDMLEDIISTHVNDFKY